MKSKYEYKRVTPKWLLSEEGLDELGKEGWELCTVYGERLKTYIF